MNVQLLSNYIVFTQPIENKDEFSPTKQWLSNNTYFFM